MTATVSGATVTLTAADGRNISVSATRHCREHRLAARSSASPPTGPRSSVVARGGVRLESSGNILTTTSGAITAAQVTDDGASVAASKSLSASTSSTTSGASSAMMVADAILDKISAGRGDLGALQNRLTSTVANLGVVSDKVSEARSRILDADFAQGDGGLTKGPDPSAGGHRDPGPGQLGPPAGPLAAPGKHKHSPSRGPVRSRPRGGGVSLPRAGHGNRDRTTEASWQRSR